MRLWTIHPQYLDTVGLTACWREALLARKVLEGNTKGYTHHPQLVRFRNSGDPLSAIDIYLSAIYDEALRRGYNYDRSKFGDPSAVRIAVKRGQLLYEFEHLMSKLKMRSLQRYISLADTGHILPHPMFDIIEEDGTEAWEILKNSDGIKVDNGI